MDGFLITHTDVNAYQDTGPNKFLQNCTKSVFFLIGSSQIYKRPTIKSQYICTVMTWNFIQVINTDTIDFSVLCLFVRLFLYSPIYTSESLLTLCTNCLLNMCHTPAEINSVVNSYEK